ncbi:hypothetical protein AAFC00_005945 [Neodothiora populina]|uniref:Uncharacterized protein n=1 Tax=Neodothiora populina TaxID=2781224 RepID=A0ABR3P6E9_9PEZI
MGLFSVLPDHLSELELWVTRIFLLLGVLTIGPWTLIIVYDFIFYLWRMATYAAPIIGGRAHGERRPRAPSLTERPNGQPREFKLRVPGDSDTDEAPRSSLHEHDASHTRDGVDGETKKSS